MTRRLLFVLCFFLVPAAILITVILKRERTFEGKSAILWIRNMQTDQDGSLLALKELGNDALPALRYTLKSSATTEKCRAALALGKLGSNAVEAVPDLIEALGDERIEVQCEVMLALSRIGTTNEGVVGTALAKLRNPRTAVPAALLLNMDLKYREAAGQRPFSNNYTYGLACSTSPVPSVRVNGAALLAQLGQVNVEAKQALNLLCDDTNSWVRQQARLFRTNSTTSNTFRLIDD